MSEEHVNAMNALLVGAPGVRAACGELSRPYVIAYRLTNGPDDQIVHWTVTFVETVQFGLAEHPRPDVVIISDWRDMVSASAAGRRGEPQDPAVEYEGDVDALAATGPALEQARAVATVAVDFPAL